MNTVHSQPIGLPATISAKCVMLINIVNASIGTQREFQYSKTSVSIDENTKFNVWENNERLLCFDVSIDTALITLLEITAGKAI